MTRTFLDTLDDLGRPWLLVDRRFSATVSDIGRLSLRKVVSATAMPFRLIAAVFGSHADTSVLFVTNRTFSFLIDCVLSAVLRALCRRRILYVHTVGFVDLAKRGRIWRWLVGRMLQSGTDVVCLGPSLVADVAPWVPADRIAVIPNTVDRPAQRGREPGPRSSQLLYLSNLLPEKGADDFVELALRLAPSMPDASFVVAGASADEDFTRALRERVAASPQAQRIHFVGPVVDPEVKWRLLDEADVLVFPSTYPFEAQPLTILEALASGTPTVGYEVGGLRDVVGKSGAGLLVPAHDVERLCGAVSALFEGSQDRAHRSESARAVFDGHFAPQRYRERWDRVLA